ncbi:MAG TPA: ATP-binding protein [Candidatus Methylomirabilis sp.]|nr:ATP-binding protein [Candidatus Methylomirabilis sp.]
MKTAIRPKTKSDSGFEDEYRSSLHEYLATGGEPALGRAYELGRRALTEQKSLVEIASLHHQAMLALVRGAESEKRREELLRSGGEFLAECLSPYEMAHRGFQDAVKALRQLNETLEEEIKRIAYAVHDEAGQLLVAVHLALAEVAGELPEPQQGQFTRIREMLNQVEKHLRRYSHELRPTILDDLGWIPAIRFLAEGISKRANLPIHIDAAVSGRPPGTIETTLYRIVQEALTNAVKHAKASNVWIRAWRENLVLCCSIRDDGGGFDSSQAHAARSRKGLGLIAMQERVSAIGGTLRIQSSLGSGTELSVQIPLEDDHANSNRARG